MKYTLATNTTEELSNIAVVKMTTGIVKLVFQKKNGSIREATGTLLPSIAKKTTKGVGARGGEGIVRFFDLSIGEWRAFRKDLIISVVTRNNFAKK
jgi:hypothetical protein